MTTRRAIILLCAIALVFSLLLGCTSGGDEWGDWQEDVGDRQRQPGQPGSIETVEAEREGK